jgi:hypothetical protein
MSRLDTEAPQSRSRAARKGWARRRLNAYLKDVESYLGYTPDEVTVWADDFDLLGGHDDRIRLKKNGPRPQART